MLVDFWHFFCYCDLYVIVFYLYINYAYWIDAKGHAKEKFAVYILD